MVPLYALQVLAAAKLVLSTTPVRENLSTTSPPGHSHNSAPLAAAFGAMAFVLVLMVVCITWMLWKLVDARVIGPFAQSGRGIFEL